MKTSDVGRRFIEIVEESGVPKLRAYNDGAGKLTIGYGHTSEAGLPRVRAGMTITADEADAIFASDLQSVEIDVRRLVKVPIVQHEFDTLVSFHFNTGKLQSSTLLRKLNNLQRDAVPKELSKWIRGGKRIMQGLVKRRECEALLWNGEVDKAIALATRYFGTTGSRR